MLRGHFHVVTTLKRGSEGVEMSKLEIEKLMRLTKQVFVSSVSTAFFRECSRHLISQSSEKSEQSHIFQVLAFIRGTLLENYVNQSHFTRHSTFHYYTLAGEPIQVTRFFNSPPK